MAPWGRLGHILGGTLGHVLMYPFGNIKSFKLFQLLNTDAKMVRKYKKKRETIVNEEDIKKAIDCVQNQTMTLRGAAAIFGITKSTLGYRMKLLKNDQKSKSEDFSTKYSVNQIFTKEEEVMLQKYILKSSKMNYGLTYNKTRLLAYQYAKALKKCPEAWELNKIAGIEWLKGFMGRHRSLSLRKPENTSLSRATSFNRHNVLEFQNNLEKVFQKKAFTPDRIYNIDETNIMTVVQAPNVIAQRGQKQVGQSVSAERGQLITMCAIVNAAGNALPPVFIYPRARFQEHMITGGPNGCIGFANSPTSGWMTGPLFVKVLEHLQKITRCTKDDLILLLLDNHESHCTLDCINFCRENGIVLLTFPPHCTHRLQPLDVSVMGPFKQKLSVAQNDWLLNHPGKTISIHYLAGIVTPAYNAAFTPNNITAGFRKPGIYPFSKNAFSDDDFVCAEVTNRPLDQTSSSETHQPNATEQENVNDDTIIDINNLEAQMDPITITILPPASEVNTEMPPAAGEASQSMKEKSPKVTHKTNEESITSLITDSVMTPEMIMPYPQAPPRQTSTKGRKKGKSRILTETPEKNEVEAAYLERQKRLEKSGLRKSKKNVPKQKPKKAKRIKEVFDSDSDQTNYSVHSDTDCALTDEEDVTMDKVPELRLELIKPGDFYLIQCATRNMNRAMAFVAKVEEKIENTLTVNFMKKKAGFNKFFFPEKEDKWTISILDILAKLPVPNEAGSTSRTAGMLTFRFDFSRFKLG